MRVVGIVVAEIKEAFGIVVAAKKEALTLMAVGRRALFWGRNDHRECTQLYPSSPKAPQ